MHSLTDLNITSWGANTRLSLAPQEDDWLYVHGPATRPLSDATAPRGNKGDTLKFNVKKNIWNEETSINLRETVLKAVPLENQDSMLLLVQEDSDAKMPLVMFFFKRQVKEKRCWYTP
jgi:hypothetical protein